MAKRSKNKKHQVEKRAAKVSDRRRADGYRRQLTMFVYIANRERARGKRILTLAKRQREKLRELSRNIGGNDE